MLGKFIALYSFRKRMKKFKNKILGIISIPVAIVFVVIVRLISPIIIIRWCAIISTRLGHFAENTNIYLSEKQLGKHDIKETYF